MPKLTKKGIDKFILDRLATTPTQTSPLDRLRQAAQKIRLPKIRRGI